ncbi:hypothetical protein C4580_05205 [Candidatus Woesearchaeota archaeon]|nr:MAG: hypothetical protein C4580_05205 [Candidatus Woesearchaeota archaeon]
MVHRVGALLLAVIGAFAVGGFLVNFDVITGQYYASGGGEWYYGPQPAQLPPDQACIYQGFEPVEPWHVYTNEYGTLLSVCKANGQLIGVPLVQTVYVWP